jgi:hypothetical protein
LGDEIVSESSNLKACLLNAGDLIPYNGEDVNFTGRLIWDMTYPGWCIDASQQAGPKLINISDAQNMLYYLTSNPLITHQDIENETSFLISGHIYGSEKISNDGNTKIIIADAMFPSTTAKIDAFVPIGMHSGWLEDGQELVANVTVIWNSETAEFQLNIIELILTGEMPPASTYDLSEGAPEWYALDKRTSIVGNLVTMDNQTYLQKEGGEQKIKINVKFNSVGTNSAHEGMTLKWTGRLIEVADDVTLAHHYVLDEADVTDENGNGIADDAEDS